MMVHDDDWLSIWATHKTRLFTTLHCHGVLIWSGWCSLLGTSALRFIPCDGIDMGCPLAKPGKVSKGIATTVEAFGRFIAWSS